MTEFDFIVCPHEGEIFVHAKYGRDDIRTSRFYINRDAVFEAFLCDGHETEAEVSLVCHPMLKSEGYRVNRVCIPVFHNCFEVRYRLKLTGETGAWAYVRERIAPEFSLLRFETFCYPMFYEGWEDFWQSGFNAPHVTVTVPEGFTAVSSVSKSGSANFFNCAVAPYDRVDFSFGQAYFLSSIPESNRQLAERVIQFGYNYMNEHFGGRDFEPITVATIPAGFGSFVRADTQTIFQDEGAFGKLESMGQLVHEFIHLYWNAVPKDTVQRARFFDEAFTCYFENRVMRQLLSEDCEKSRTYKRRGAERAINAIKKGGYKLVPICKYGEMEYGDLSYSVGALCLEELEVLLGEKLFDNATAHFLTAHQKTPADFEDFCQAYIKYCGVAYEA